MIGPALTDTNIQRLREAHLQAARRASGLEDFGPDDFTEPLDLLLEDLVQRARLSRFGHLIAPYYLQQILRERLRVHQQSQYIAATHPPPPDHNPPVVILGLPRTGSTLLHELLHLHVDLRAPTFWESHHLPQTTARDTLTRLQTRAQVQAVDWLAPTFRRIHQLRATGPHECVSIQAYTFRSMQFHAAFRLPHYDSWMRGGMHWQPAYTWHRRHLTVLAHSFSGAQSPGTRWVLKAPGHMLGLQALLRTYPDAQFIQLHRDPAAVIPSMASLTLSLRGIASKQHDLKEIGDDVNRLWHAGISLVMQARQKDPALNARFLDLPYQDLVGAPARGLKAIAHFINVPFTPDYERRVNRYLTQHQQHRHGAHGYALQQFGLERELINEMYRPYMDAYGIA